MTGAFFDIDGTLYRSSLLVEHFKKLIKYEVIDERLWLEKVKQPYMEWSIRKGDYEHYTEVVAGAYRDSMAGLKAEDNDFLVNQVIKQNWERTYVYTRERIHWHKEQGHLVFFISGSPDFLVKKMAELYQADAYMGSVYELDENGCYTGVVQPMWDSVNKKRVLLRYVQDHGINLASSFAYGDTGGDYTMLELVGHPVAINPNRNLYTKMLTDPAMKDKAKIVVERKDLIYEMALANVKILG